MSEDYEYQYEAMKAKIPKLEACIEELEAQVAKLEADNDLFRDQLETERIHHKRRIAELEAQAKWEPVLTDYERKILLALLANVKDAYNPGEEAWTNTVVIEAWLENYSGTCYED